MHWQNLTTFTLMVVLGGCNAPDNLPLVFYQATTVGITANASPAQGSPEISLGYRDTDVAVVPVIAGGRKVRGVSPVNSEDSLNEQESSLILSGSKDKQKTAKFEDALSVFGQFQVDTNADTKSQTASIGLGKFFATGLAARSLAVGFKCKIADKATTCK
jgi:hypothetical protein